MGLLYRTKYSLVYKLIVYYHYRTNNKETVTGKEILKSCRVVVDVQVPVCNCSVLRYLSVTIVTLYPVRHDRYMIVKVHSYVKVILLIPSTVL